MGYKIFLILAVIGILIFLCPATGMEPQSLLPANRPENQAIPVTGAEAFVGCPGAEIDIVNSEYEQAIVELTNEVRAEQSLPPLKRVSELDESARYHAADMSHDDYFDHNTFDRDERGLVASCDTWERMENYYTYWSAMGENIAAGQRTPQSAMEGWMNSPDHYHNLMSDNYWEIGVGFFEGEGSYRYYWDQNFGRRLKEFPLIINGEKAETLSTHVDVFVYGEWDEMRLRIDNGEWSKWTDFQSTFPVILPETLGEHQVSVELRGLGQTTESSDRIELVQKQTSVLDQVMGFFDRRN